MAPISGAFKVFDVLGGLDTFLGVIVSMVLSVVAIVLS
jgi:hypothetical protein